jgi:hypothetical protein
MKQDIGDHCKACHKCALGKPKAIPKAVMKPTTTEVHHKRVRWQVDVIGPFTRSGSGNTYAITAQDAFSKWPEARAVARSPTTRDVIAFIEEQIIAQYDTVPKEIMTDQGSIFKSREFRTFLRGRRIAHLPIAPYHHQSNGVVERYNGTLESEFRTNAPSPAQWDEVIEHCLFTYRTTHHRTTKKTPFLVMHGFHPRLPIDHELSLQTPPSPDPEVTRLEVLAEIEKEAMLSKRRYDRDRKAGDPRDLHGRKVYWKELATKPDGKLSPWFKGPFLAERTECPWNFRIVDSGGNCKTVHVDQLKLCYNADQPLAAGLRDRGRPRRTDEPVITAVYTNSSLKREGWILKEQEEGC